MRSQTLAAIGVVTLSLAVAAASQNPPQLKRFSEPVESKVDGALAYCIDAAPVIRVCDVDRGDRGFALTMYADQKPTVLAEKRFRVYQEMFSLLLADVDGTGGEELIVVDHLATSNGMAMRFDRITIVADYLGGNRSWVSFTVDEFGRGPGTFIRQAGRPGFAIFSTEWEWHETLDPQRVRGNYLVGRWFQYAKGRLVPEPGIVIRRLLNSFADERSTDMEHQPYSFFANGKGRAVDHDPALGTGSATESLRGTVEKVSPDEYGEATFDLRMDDGRRTTATFGYPDGNSQAEYIGNVALATINRVLPKGVLPAAVVGDVTGHRVRLERYQDGKSETRVLWIE